MNPDFPQDFPRDYAASLAGIQPKLAVRVVDGKYVTGYTDEELHARWLFCEDLAVQLKDRTLRKISEGKVSDLERFYTETERRSRVSGWGVSEAELQWILSRMKTLVSSAKKEE